MEYFRRISFYLSLLFALQFLTLVTGAFAGEKPGRKAPDIMAVHVDYSAKRAIINGRNFDSGSIFQVELGSHPLEVLWYDANSILVSLPESFEAVDLRLSVQTGPSSYQTDYFDLTFGSAGPQGPRGEQGPQGPAGSVGLQGPVGLTGEQGLQGEQGPQGPVGLMGASGPTGAAGPAGSEGIEGIAGNQGTKGQAGTVQARNIRVYKPTITVRAVTPLDIASGNFEVTKEFYYACPSGGALINGRLELHPSESTIYDAKISILDYEMGDTQEVEPLPAPTLGYSATVVNSALISPPATFTFSMVCAW